MQIILPFPDSSLNPNRKNGKHWSVTNKAKNTAKEYAYYATREARERFKSEIDIKVLEIYFIAPDKRKRDLDNLLASAKNSIDGICLALGIDDHEFDKVIINRGYQKNNGHMLVEFKAKCKAIEKET
jgi:Holliday junction resolvase RusA-like endonuclease